MLHTIVFDEDEKERTISELSQMVGDRFTLSLGTAEAKTIDAVRALTRRNAVVIQRPKPTSLLEDVTDLFRPERR